MLESLLKAPGSKKTFFEQFFLINKNTIVSTPILHEINFELGRKRHPSSKKYLGVRGLIFKLYANFCTPTKLTQKLLNLG